jgi:hypothetical protein
VSQRYVVVIEGVTVELPSEGVLWWVRGVADAHGDRSPLNKLSATAPDDINRMHALQIAEEQGWLTYDHVSRAAQPPGAPPTVGGADDAAD